MKSFKCAEGFRKASLLGVAVSVSALFGLEFKVERDIPYRSPENLAQEGEYAQNRCKLDIRWPAGTTNFATVIHFHNVFPVFTAVIAHRKSLTVSGLLYVRKGCRCCVVFPNHIVC